MPGYPRGSLTPLQPDRRQHWPTRKQVRCTTYLSLTLVRLLALLSKLYSLILPLRLLRTAVLGFHFAKFSMRQRLRARF